MSKDDEKWLLSQSGENPEPSSNENTESSIPSIGDSGDSMENIRKAMEIPPRTSDNSNETNIDDK